VLLRPPDTELPFLLNLTGEALPSRQESCGHCQAPVGDACNITRLPHTCCGVCQFDSRLCGKLYPGEGRSEAAAAALLQDGYPLHVGFICLYSAGCLRFVGKCSAFCNSVNMGVQASSTASA
jgi:hypothetical protein